MPPPIIPPPMPNPPPPPRPPPPPPGPPRPPPGGGPPGGGPLALSWLAGVAEASLGPMPNPRLMRRLTASAAGPSPRLTGRSVSLELGIVSRQPNAVCTYSLTVLDVVEHAVAEEA